MIGTLTDATALYILALVGLLVLLFWIIAHYIVSVAKAAILSPTKHDHWHLADTYGCPVCDVLILRGAHGMPLGGNGLTKKGRALLFAFRESKRQELKEHWNTFHGSPKR